MTTEELILQSRISQVLAIGGGSAIDHMKDVRRRLLDRDYDLACIAVPTTLSGAEWSPLTGVTRSASKDVHTCVKAMPDVVIHDGALAWSTPNPVWVASAVKALSSAVERGGSRDANPLTVAFCAQGLEEIIIGLLEGNQVGATRLALLGASFKISFLGGEVRSGVGGALRRAAGALTGLSHGSLASAFLLHTLRFNWGHIPAIENQLQHLFRAHGTGDQPVLEGLDSLLRLNGLPTRLRDLPVRRNQVEEIAHRALRDPGLHGNARDVNGTADLVGLLESAW